MLLCSGGMDNERRAYLEAELKARDGSIDVGYQTLVRNAILAMVKDLEIPEDDRKDAAVEIQQQYLDCIGPELDKFRSEQREEQKRIELAKCLSGCCDIFDCEEDCPITSYRGISYPSGDGSSCQEYVTDKFGCRLDAFGVKVCTWWPERISYRELRSCMRDC